jgi:hypothetical protein
MVYKINREGHLFNTSHMHHYGWRVSGHFLHSRPYKKQDNQETRFLKKVCISLNVTVKKSIPVDVFGSLFLYFPSFLTNLGELALDLLFEYEDYFEFEGAQFDLDFSCMQSGLESCGEGQAARLVNSLLKLTSWSGFAWSLKMKIEENKFGFF